MNVAFVSPRLHEGGSVGGAETLLFSLARDAAALGHRVEFLTTCAKNHFTWANELPAGESERDGIAVRRFPVDPRDEGRLARLQTDLAAGRRLSPAEQLEWISNTANSAALVAHLRANAARYDRVVCGPYLFGLVRETCLAVPEKTLLVPCFHDEPYARVEALTDAFRGIRGFLFNTDPERALARRLVPGLAPRVEAVVAMGIEPFEADKTAFARRTGISAPYVVYSGRREEGKGTPVLVDFLDCFRRRTGRDVHLVMTGSGPVDVPPDLAPAFHDLGFVSEREKREAMAGAAAFVHPSVNESLSIVVLEAWLARTPALVHARGEVLRWQCASSCGGLWFRDYPEFEAALERLLDDASLSAKLGEQGRRYVLERYAPEAVRARFAAALEA
ncbi:MAG: glycosyltransferase family 4 protein [Kiritimatiellae bacterium]|nr:glycosyltransferase family 4 protein [Kiritimatiellia bacterium]